MAPLSASGFPSRSPCSTHSGMPLMVMDLIFSLLGSISRAQKNLTKKELFAGSALPRPVRSSVILDKFWRTEVVLERRPVWCELMELLVFRPYLYQ